MVKTKKKGHSFLGIRLDSGDLSALSIQARQLLDKAGFEDAIILASDSLDEYQLKTLKTRMLRLQLGSWYKLSYRKRSTCIGSGLQTCSHQKKERSLAV